MKQRIFSAIIAVSLAVLVLFALIIGLTSYDTLQEQAFSTLATEASYLTSGTETLGKEYLESLPQGDNRITWVAPDGTVLFDSGSSSAPMENHADRPEIREALENGSAQVIRDSETHPAKTLYYAQRLADGSVLRIAARSTAAFSLVYGLLGRVVGFAILALILAAMLATAVSRRITRPINNINLDHPTQAGLYPELQPLAERLQHQNEVIARQMEQIRQENADREALRREFTANVSHELKTPLTAISGTAEILKSGMVKEQDVPHFAGNIYHEAQRMTALVTDILKLSQLDENRIPQEKEIIDLYPLAGKVIEWLHDEAAKKSVTISLTGTHARILGVRKLVEEMLVNLCDNAIKYNYNGGAVFLDISLRDTKAVVTVRDTGIGIPREHQSRVFERFYRVDKSHSREIGGTGLGLSIVKHSALFHEAELSLASEVGKGTTITVSFPSLR